MHPALCLQEILHVIFGHCYDLLPTFGPTCNFRCPDLVALAATCRAFKEPALNVLWAELEYSNPLLRCLPDVCYLDSSISSRPTYKLKRRLTSSERDHLRSYTCRIRSLRIPTAALYIGQRTIQIDPESFADICSSRSPADRLFPNIRKISGSVTDSILPLIHHIIVPELKSLSLQIYTSNISSSEWFAHSLGPDCPNMEDMTISLEGGKSEERPVGFDQIMNRHIRCWTRLLSLSCLEVNMDIDTFTHLSNAPKLSWLTFVLDQTLASQIAVSNRTLVFSALQIVDVKSGSIVNISKLFTNVLLPAATNISIRLYDEAALPTGYRIKSFSTALAKSWNCKSAARLSIQQSQNVVVDKDQDEAIRLTLEDIYPLMTFNLSRLIVDLDCIIDLKDGDVLDLASAFPKLLALSINSEFGWRTPGITLTCLVQLVQRCPSLWHIHVAIDTRSYPHPPEVENYRASVQQRRFQLDVVDSAIEEKSIPVLAAFFVVYFPLLFDGHEGKVHDYGGPPIRSWQRSTVMARRSWLSSMYKERWIAVGASAKRILSARSVCGQEVS